MPKRLYAGLLAAALLVASGTEKVPAAEASSSGDPADWTPEQRKLLQDTLSLSELQRDTERIAEEQNELARQGEKLSGEIETLQTRIASSRERADTVVRSQYMQGQRPMLLSLLNARSFGELTRIYYYYEFAIRHDQELLLGFREDSDRLQNRKDQLAANSARLEEVKRGIEQQRARLTALQADIDSGLLTSDDPASLRRLADELNVYWSNVGLFEVDEYFSQLAAASEKLPDFLQNSGKLKVSGLGTRYTIELTDAELNDFLRSQSEDFADFSFSFENGRVVAEGKQDRLTLRIEGRYTLENEPQNAVLFHVDKLIFNGLELPESTRLELERKYDLGFYPQQVAPVKVDDVEMQDGYLKIELQLVL
ncbi:hypothetical protein CDO73_15050 [Saccharibacillus sp. O23]|uniref:hypothetical protein n=1 Tax=Saccharibacillus sp. O23 TaxID=2009338 RepID=UPI000B4E73EF|nr:hypothetical protein [Saccharibacillus sp. O23]OWR29506.1 hypothetical protein CDO73_15050 [Saccharibacillus sp. O23]